MKTNMKHSESAKKKAIMAQVDDYFKTCLMYSSVTKELLAEAKKTIREIVRFEFPAKEYKTIIEVYTVGDTLHAMIGFRRFDRSEFTILNAAVTPEA